jgi:multidrug efflux system outer membrane protein
MRTSRFALAVGVLLTAGCAGLPPAPAPAGLPSSLPLSPAEDGAGGEWPAKEWWRRYHDESLDRVIALALASSPTLVTAHARFDSARQSVRLAGAATGAHVDMIADADRQRLSDTGLFPPQLLGFTWYNQSDLGLHASYTFDWWDKQRSVIGAAMDEAHAVQAERSAATLVLASSVADAYFGWQADQGRLSLANERLDAAQREGAIAAARVHAELDAADTLHRTDSTIAAAREQIAALEGSAQLRIVALAALVGRPPTDLLPLVAKPLPTVQGGLPENVRIDLIARRADIAVSRWRVESVEKSRAAARAEFYPDISVNVLAGLSSVDLGKLLEYRSRVPEIGAAIHLPIFDSGRLKARYGAAEVQIRSAVAGYEQTLVEAARDVSMQVATRAQLTAQRAQRAIEVDATAQLRATAAARVRQGIADSRTELVATETWIEQRDALLQLDAAALSADVGLQRALGGGYENPMTASL